MMCKQFLIFVRNEMLYAKGNNKKLIEILPYASEVR